MIFVRGDQLDIDCSPAEAVLNLKSNEVLRLSFSRSVMAGRKKWIELYVWICRETSFFLGLYDLSGNKITEMNEIPWNSKQLLRHINETNFQPGIDVIEKLPTMNVSELQKLHNTCLLDKDSITENTTNTNADLSSNFELHINLIEERH